jgi:hypothetical protein
MWRIYSNPDCGAIRVLNIAMLIKVSIAMLIKVSIHPKVVQNSFSGARAFNFTFHFLGN